MNKSEVKQRVITVIETTWDWFSEDLDGNDTFDEMGADSLDQAELIMELEKEFSIQVKDDEAEGVKNIEDVVNEVCKILGVEM
jgi:acyl carrier protein